MSGRDHLSILFQREVLEEMKDLVIMKKLEQDCVAALRRCSSHPTAAELAVL